VRINCQVVPGVEGVTSYEGFYIVGWWDGHVEMVPVEAVRLLKVGDDYTNVYPGMRENNDSLPLMITPPGTVNEQQLRAGGLTIDQLTMKSQP
jgi:prepilin-type processing-associated H-X9-DG protein